MTERLLIDVTKIEPRLKHPTIFSTFDNLVEGDALLLHNDHDPKPLYYQLLGERGNIFTWQYEKSGPEVWEVEIRKNIAGKVPETLGDIAAKDIRKADVFRKLGLDFCCGGKMTLEEACKEKGLDVIAVREELKRTEQTATVSKQHDFNSWTNTFLVDYIVNVHHAYVRENMSVLSDLAERVADHHGKTNSELLQIRDNVVAIIKELTVHMKKEEHILFPYVKQIEESKLKGLTLQSGFGSVQSPISVMEQDHEFVGNLLKEIRVFTDNYTLPANACNSYNLLYKKLQEFEADLHIHIHLENNILFPKSVEMEQSMKQS